MVEAAARNAELLFEHRAILHRIEQAQWRFVHGRALERVERHLLHQVLQALGDGALAAPHRAQQVENLLALFQALRSVAEEAHHLLDGVFHAVELCKRGVAADHLVGKQAREVRIIAGIYHLWLADGGQHAVRSPLVDHRVALAQNKKLVERHFLFAQAHVASGRVADDIHTTSVAAPKGLTMPQSC
ncbi:hypothetical protein D3C72_1645170 [compost metagenome]